jgi:hypothetical protein
VKAVLPSRDLVLERFLRCLQVQAGGQEVVQDFRIDVYATYRGDVAELLAHLVSSGAAVVTPVGFCPWGHCLAAIPTAEGAASKKVLAYGCPPCALLPPRPEEDLGLLERLFIDDRIMGAGQWLASEHHAPGQNPVPKDPSDGRLAPDPSVAP